MQFTSTIAAAVLAVTASASYSGRMTYYDPSVGYGSCGAVYQPSDFIVALDPSLWTSANPNADPLCGRTIAITYNGVTTNAKVTDKCPSCAAGAIDVSQAVFESFASTSVGVLQVSWDFV